jgi:beta-lactamase class A
VNPVTRRNLLPASCINACVNELYLLCFILLGAAFSQTGTSLEKALQREAARNHGHVGFYAKDLASGQTVALNADVPAPTASTIKLLALLEAMHELHDGRKKLEDEIVLKKDDQVAGSGVLQFFATPLKITFADALSMMVIQSDNTATNLVIDHLGRDQINHRAESMGLKNTYLYKKVYRKPEGPMPADQKTFGLGKTTPREMAEIMQRIVQCEVKDEALCAKVVSMLKNQSYRNMIPKYIEPELDWTEGESRIGDKIGQVDDSRSDVAAIWSPHGLIIISGYTYDNHDTRWNADNEAEAVIARMAKTVYDAWTPPVKAAPRVK